MKKAEVLKKRRIYLATGVFAMLFSGVLYAWSILKVPFAEVFSWSAQSLALNFTLTMCFFCLGAFAGSLICKKIGPGGSLFASGVLVGLGFVITGLLNETMLWLLYISYAILAGSGIGISYNVVVSTVNAWFPDKKGLCSGCLMMGFGISTLLLGEVISKLFENSSVGFGKTYIILGIVIALVIIIAGLILKLPAKGDELPSAKEAALSKEAFETRDFTTVEMLKNFSFIKSFVALTFIAAAGNSVISFARDLVLSVDATPSLATTLVGVLAIFNGVGRVLTGLVYDKLGRRITMISASVLTVFAASVALAAVKISSLPVMIAGLCLTGISYGSCPTITSAFTASFYGRKHFSTNYSIANFNLIFASFIANAANSLLSSTGGYSMPFTMLLILSVVALLLNISIKRP